MNIEEENNINKIIIPYWVKQLTRCFIGAVVGSHIVGVAIFISNYFFFDAKIHFRNIYDFYFYFLPNVVIILVTFTGGFALAIAESISIKFKRPVASLFCYLISIVVFSFMFPLFAITPYILFWNFKIGLISGIIRTIERYKNIIFKPFLSSLICSLILFVVAVISFLLFSFKFEFPKNNYLFQILAVSAIASILYFFIIFFQRIYNGLKNK